METINPETQTEVPKSILEQTNDAIKKLEEQNERMENNISTLANEKLSGTSGGHIEPTPIPKLTAIEYANKFMKGEVNPLKDDGISIN